jgi:soluble lytic murein transglycosylase
MGRKSSGLVRFARLAGTASLLALAVPAGALTDAQKSWYAARLADNARGQFSDPMLGGLLPRTPDSLAETVVQWDRLRRDDYAATFADLSAFLRTHPGWPQELVMRRSAERALQPDTPMADRIAYFTRFPPVTASGAFRYAEALLASGRRDEALRFARQAWTSDGLSAAGETELLGKFSAALTGADHAARVDRLIWSNQTTAAQRVLGLVPADRRAPLEARLALRSRAVDADGRYLVLTDAQRADPGVVMDRAIWLRDGQRVDEARRLVADAATLPGAPVDPVRWMTFRLELARGAARDGQNDLAYRIAANHRSFPLGRPLNSWSDSERDKLTDLEWLAGWTALKATAQPARAVDHFQNYRNAAQSPITQARGDYWAGRAAEAAGDRHKARRFYESAATHPDYFFGQLSLERLGRPVTVARPQPVTVSPQVRQAFENSEMVRVVRMLSELGDRPRETLFLRTMVERADTLAEQRRPPGRGSTRSPARKAGSTGRPSAAPMRRA